ncbi:TonB family protein [Ottowia sp.]|uniref:energy transducer TonB n=1 Tax=Ottowia sp. TaxID=1898956 RepID=UPI00262DD9B2|nr:TonB family protein [Ottowia sp.]
MAIASRKSLSVLQWALLFSLGVHALLLAVRFVDPEGFNRVFENTALDVVLVNTQSDEKPVKAQAIAQHNLAGGGDAADAKTMATTPLPNTGQESIGVDVIDENQRRIDAMKEQQEQLLAQIREQLAAMPDADPAQAAETPEAKAQEERRRQLAKLMAKIEARIQEENARPRKRYLSPATLGSTYAVYYDELRRKIERRGTENFPEFGGKKLYGELMMAILVNHDGRILDAKVVRGSGNRILDRLAEAIAQASAPFGNFTPAMRKDTDQIDITARFRFTREQTLETTLQSDQLTNAVQDKLR